MSGRRERGVTAQVCPGGPLLLRGADCVRDADGVIHEVTRPVAAVCLCGRSQRGPWCDGTHKFLNRPDHTGT
ncbi:CDGSH iron-sulfur domain-containing protein [Nocardioides sp.]|uniref:CDGSH iron-sulfur domain-containing protein n=1 Tax=Nocardioides sp. TaxID=35761 RepID=UPI0027369FF3|nr:CDGSH iron-sulfur domain-containing protein [Nocardioides sp.]MDP3893478.1 CDGSH iron-sulfur domain-containing protein [Nocardioides sp.]